MMISHNIPLEKIHPHLDKEHLGVIVSYLFNLEGIFKVEVWHTAITVYFHLESIKSGQLDLEKIKSEVQAICTIDMGFCPCGCGQAISLGVCRVQSGPDPTSLNLTAEEQSLIKQRQLIAAIKSLRTRTGLGLRECKDIVDSYTFSAISKPT